MPRFNLITLIAALAALVAIPVAHGNAGNLWSIYWLMDSRPCAGWAAPIVSAYYPVCTYPGSAVQLSICPSTFSGQTPFSQGLPIIVTGWQLTHILSDPTSRGQVVVGKGGAGGADVFASAGGIGTYHAQHTLSVPLQASGAGGVRGGNYFDVYAACTTGEHEMIVVLEYTTQ